MTAASRSRGIPRFLSILGSRSTLPRSTRCSVSCRLANRLLETPSTPPIRAAAVHEVSVASSTVTLPFVAVFSTSGFLPCYDFLICCLLSSNHFVLHARRRSQGAGSHDINENTAESQSAYAPEPMHNLCPRLIRARATPSSQSASQPDHPSLPRPPFAQTPPQQPGPSRPWPSPTQAHPPSW